MSVATMPAHVAAELTTRKYELMGVAKKKVDDAIVRFDAWFLVFVAVILALGAVLIVGMSIWCVVKQGKRFTGRWSFRNFGLSVYFECV